MDVERKAETLLAYLRDRTDSEFAVDVAGEFGEDLKARIEGVIANQAEALSRQKAAEARIIALLRRIADYGGRVFDEEQAEAQAILNSIGADLED